MKKEELYAQLCLTARQGGAVAQLLQGNVQNIGKDAEVLPGDNTRTQAVRAAKTIVDGAVQEIILLALAEHVDTSTIQVDAEEETPSLALFPSDQSTMSIVIDPIDGTLEYLEGKDSYSVCIAVVEDGEMRMAIEYFPKRDTALGLAPDGKSYLYQKFATHGVQVATVLSLPSDPPHLILQNRRVPETLTKKLQAAGFEMQFVEHFAEGLFRIVRGEAAGILLGTPQTRDVMISPMIATAGNGFMCDWSGNEIMWPARGRVSEVFAGNTAVEKEIRHHVFKS